jgi:hypothetical protein
MARNDTDAPAPKRQEGSGPKPQDTKTMQVYAVMQTTIPRLVHVYPPEEETEEILDLYMSLEDANTRVRREWEEFEDGEEGEGIEGEFDGVDNWFEFEDEGGEQEGTKIYIKAWDVKPAGSETAREWKRPPPQELPADSEDEEKKE